MATVNLIDVSKYHGQQPILDSYKSCQLKRVNLLQWLGLQAVVNQLYYGLIAGLDTVSKGSILINNQCVNEITSLIIAIWLWFFKIMRFIHT